MTIHFSVTGWDPVFQSEVAAQMVYTTHDLRFEVQFENMINVSLIPGENTRKL